MGMRVYSAADRPASRRRGVGPHALRIHGAPDPIDSAAVKPRGLGSANDEDVALGAVDHLRADRSHEKTLERIEPAAPDDRQVRIRRRSDDHVAGITLGLDRLNLDPALRQVRLRVVEVAPPSLDLRWVEVRAL